METFLYLATAAASLFALARLAFLAYRARKRRVEIEEAERDDRLVFYDEIDDFCLVDEIKKSIACILVLCTCPLSLIDLFTSSHTGPVATIVSFLTCGYGYILLVKKIDSLLFK